MLPKGVQVVHYWMLDPDAIEMFPRQVGLLIEEHKDYFPYLRKLYKPESSLNSARLLKMAFCNSVIISFIGALSVSTHSLLE